MNVYVFEVGSARLELFASVAEAISGRDRDALRRQDWLFFAADGNPLRVDLFADGGMQMRPWASCSSCTLAQILPFVREAGDGVDLTALADGR